MKAEAESEKAKGNAAFGKGLFEEAFGLYNRAIASEPKDATLLSNASMALLRLERWNEAVAFATRAIEADNAHIKSYYRRAVAHRNLKEYVDARLDLERILALDRENKSALEEIGQVRMLEKKMKRDLRERFGQLQRRHSRPGPPKQVHDGPAAPETVVLNDKTISVQIVDQLPDYLDRLISENGTGGQSRDQEELRPELINEAVKPPTSLYDFEKLAQGNPTMQGALALVCTDSKKVETWYGVDSAGVEPSVLEGCVHAIILLEREQGQHLSQALALMEALSKSKRFNISKLWIEQKDIAKMFEVVSPSLNPQHVDEMRTRWKA